MPVRGPGRGGDVSRIRLICGDALEQLPLLEASSIDAIVTDPPYHLTVGKRGGSGAASENPNSPAGRSRATTGFMGKAWDGGEIAHDPAVWREALRIAKPGAHLLAFGGTRTFHRLTCAIEDAGWEIRDCLMWVYGSGFPKSLDVSKAIDKAAGAERAVVGIRTLTGRAAQSTKQKGGTHTAGAPSSAGLLKDVDVTAPATAAARQWQGWGTALKPAWEPIILARKPLEGTVAENVQRWGTGALNIDGCRVHGGPSNGGSAGDGMGYRGAKAARAIDRSLPLGRWPANLLHDGSEEVVGMFPQSDTARIEKPSDCSVEGSTSFECMRGNRPARGYNEQGSAARFFYCAKANRSDRDEGCEGLPETLPLAPNGSPNAVGATRGSLSRPRSNSHPTVKPTDLMRYLCRLVTPPGGAVLDPFMGSGSTGKAALLEGFSFIGMDNAPEYIEIARRRIEGTAPLFADSLLNGKIGDAT